MAKKAVHRMEAYDAKVESDGADKSIIIFHGWNTNGTEVQMKIEVRDYFFPHIIKDMAKITRQRLAAAQRRLQDVKTAVDPV